RPRRALPSCPTRRSSDLLLLRLLDAPERGIARLVDAKLDRQHGRAAHGHDLFQPALELAVQGRAVGARLVVKLVDHGGMGPAEKDRKSTRLNSSHVSISY